MLTSKLFLHKPYLVLQLDVKLDLGCNALFHG